MNSNGMRELAALLLACGYDDEWDVVQDLQERIYDKDFYAALNANRGLSCPRFTYDSKGVTTARTPASTPNKSNSPGRIQVSVNFR